MKRNKGVGFIVMVLLLAGALCLSIFGLTIYNDKGRPAFQIKSSGEIRYGIDIRGGVEAIFQPEDNATNVTNDRMDSARSVIERRLDANNITDRDVTIDYERKRIFVRFPWKSTESNFDPNTAIQELGQMGRLSFRYYNGIEILAGSEVTKAVYATDQNGRPIVNLEFSAEGATKFAEATKNVMEGTIPEAGASPSPEASPSPAESSEAVPDAKKRIAIYLDEDMISNPIVQAIIADGKCVIENIGSDAEAKNLANLISSGSLPFKLISKSNNSISPTLGTQALELMTVAGGIAFILVCLFMLLVYRLPGFVACFALLGQVLGQLLTLSISQFTLTLPGIAGIILSIGMGVDANVISAERVKEEVYAGKTVRAAIDAGYHKAFSAVADGNVTVAIVAILLWILGTGPMISFGFTLLIGVIFNFVCGVGVSKVMLKSLVGFKFSQNKWLYGYSKSKVVEGGAKNA